MSDNKGRLDEATTRRLLWDFGREDELIYYADLRGDFTVVVSHHLAKGDAQKAIQVLRRPGVPPELYYTFAPQLLALSPTAAVDAWIAAGDALEARRLVPALMRPDREEDGQGQGAGAPVHSDGLSGAGRAEARAQVRRPGLPRLTGSPRAACLCVGRDTITSWRIRTDEWHCDNVVIFRRRSVSCITASTNDITGTRRSTTCCCRCSPTRTVRGNAFPMPSAEE